MKKIPCYSFLLLFSLSVYSQTLIIKGKIKCLNQSVNSTKGAENIVVVPTFMPSKSTITVTRPAGYFEFNTGVPIEKLQDKTVTVYVISRCTNCKEAAKRVFISQDQDRQNAEDHKEYVTVKDWMLKTNCQKAELIPLAADSVLAVVSKQPDQDLDKMTPASALTGTPAFLNFLTNLTSVVGLTTFPTGQFALDTIFPGKVNYGQFLFASPLSQSANTGFNFSPSRDLSEAAFWNPSAITNSRKPYNISLLTNLKNNIKASAFCRISNKVFLSAGFIHTTQDEFRRVAYTNTTFTDSARHFDSAYMNLKEYAAFFSPVFRLTKDFSVALTVKSIWQNFTIPFQMDNSGKVIEGQPLAVITDSTVKKQKFDADISATYKLSNAFQIGINLMNLAGTKLYDLNDGVLVYSKKNIPFRNLRSLGLGLTYKWQRLNIGADLLFTDDGLYDVAFGVNYVPFNNALISAGIAVKQVSYSFAFRLKYFRLAYINDNDWLVNEKRTGKSNILNGRLYGGFIIDLN